MDFSQAASTPSLPSQQPPLRPLPRRNGCPRWQRTPPPRRAASSCGCCCWLLLTAAAATTTLVGRAAGGAARAVRGASTTARTAASFVSLPPTTRSHRPYPLQQQPLRRGYASTGALRLNRLLFEAAEVSVSSDGGRCRVRLPPEDPRAVHVREILQAQDGDTLRAGVLDAGRTDAACIAWGANGDLDIDLGPAPALLRPCPDTERPRVDLILAMQAPIRLERMVPHIAALGVGRLVIVGASKVERSYWGSHFLRRPEAMRALITEGLCQAGDTAVPEVIVERRLKKFLQDDLPRLYPAHSSSTIRAIAHPSRNINTSPQPRLRDLRPPPSLVVDVDDTAAGGAASPLRPPSLVVGDTGTAAAAAAGAVDSLKPSRVLLAVGPESGWEEPFELDLFHAHGFQAITMGERVLRTEAAVPALLALAHDRLDALDQGRQSNG